MSKQLLASSIQAVHQLLEVTLSTAKRNDLAYLDSVRTDLKDTVRLYMQYAAKARFLELSNTLLLAHAENEDIQSLKVKFRVGPEYNDNGYDLSISVSSFKFIEKSGKAHNDLSGEVYDWSYDWGLEEIAAFLPYTPSIEYMQEVELSIADFPAFCEMLEKTNSDPELIELHKAITHTFIGKEDTY